MQGVTLTTKNVSRVLTALGHLELHERLTRLQGQARRHHVGFAEGLKESDVIQS
jgi:hypothetical protein